MVVLEHFTIAGIVASCEQDGFHGIDLFIVSVDIFDDDSRYSASVFANQLARPSAEHEVHAASNANVVNIFHVGRMGGQANLAYVVEVVPVVFDVCIGGGRPVHFANAHGRAIVGIAFGASAVLPLRRAEIPIQSFGGVVGPKLDDGHLGTIAAFLHNRSCYGGFIYFDAERFLDLSAARGDLVRANLERFTLFDDGDFLSSDATFDCGTRCRHSRHARADYHDIDVDGFLDVARGNSLRLLQERRGGIARVARS